MDETVAASDGNLTNLALKSIIAIGAMREMSRANGNDLDAQLYGVSLFCCLWACRTDVEPSEQGNHADGTVAVSGAVLRSAKYPRDVWCRELVVSYIQPLR